MDTLITIDGRSASLTTLSPHPNDPGNTGGSRSREFLTEFTVTTPAGIDSDTVDDMWRREAVRAAELGRAGVLLRLWALPGTLDQRRALGLWSAEDEGDLAEALQSLPLYPWMTVTTHLVDRDAA